MLAAPLCLLLLAAGPAVAIDIPANPFDRELAAQVAAVHRLARSPEAVVPLYRIADLEDFVARPTWERALREAAAAVAQPLARAHAEQLLADLDDQRDGAAAAAERRAALGFLSAFAVVGPFDNEGRKGFGEVYAPEKETDFDPARTYEGRERKIGWRDAQAVVRRGVVPLEGLLRPDTNVVGYATAFFRLDSAQVVAVRAGSTGAVKIWVDGRLALAHDVYRPLRLDQDAGGVRLGAGLHRILVKVCAIEVGWSFLLRLTRPDGKPLGFHVVPLAEARGAAARRGAPPPRSAVATLAPLLRGRALGELLAHVAPDDPDDKVPEQLLRKACAAEAGAECLLRLAEVTSDANDRRQVLERAVTAARAGAAGSKAGAGGGRPLEARALGALGDALSAARREREAEGLWRRALAADPAFWPAALRLCELLADRGLLAPAETQGRAVHDRLPDVPRVVAAFARLLERRGRRDLAERVYEPLFRAAPADPTLLRERYGFARARGDGPAALAALGALVRQRPDSIVLAFERADLEEGAGRLDEAEAALTALSAQVPDEPRAWERLGRLLARRGRKTEAVRALRRALALRPQSPEVRELCDRLDPKGESDLSRGFARDLRTVVKANQKKSFAGAPSAVLLDLKATRVHANGLSEVYVQRIVRILDERGVREEADQAVRYTPETQSVEVRAARVLKASGQMAEATGRDDRDLSEPWYGLYYDLRAQLVRFERLEPGDTIELAYVISDVGRRNLFADYFGDLHFFQEDTPRAETVYALYAPASRPLYFNQPRLPGLKHVEELRGSERYYEWRGENMPRVELEPGMPGWSEDSAYLHVSTYKTWEEVGAWYFGLVRDQIALDAPMREAAQRATAGLSDELARVRAIHDLVVRQTRYVGLEFGIHGFKPYRTTQVFARKFGDCKDKASLLVALLRAIGVEANLVIVRTRRGGDIDEFPASLAIFDHAIAYVPKYDLWLDGTAEYAGTTELPAPDQGVRVLVLGPSGARFTRTPVYPPARNRVVRREKLRLSSAAGARIDERITITGQATPEWREHYQAAGERRERYEKAWNGRLPGARVVSVEMPSLDDLERPLEVHAEVEAPNVGRPSGGGFAVPATGRESELARTYARLSARKHDLVLGYPWEQDEKFEYELPSGFRADRLPEARRLETPFGSFEIQAEADGARVTVAARLKVARNRIGRGEYDAFRRFLLDVDAASNQEIVVSR